MARVSGSVSDISVPAPGVERMVSVPPRYSILPFTTSMPTPRPETFVADAAVEKPGAHVNMNTSDSDRLGLMEVGEDVRALAVRELLGRQEIVIKPLSPLFKTLGGLGGATVLGDGRVALILDPRTLFTMGR